MNIAVVGLGLIGGSIAKAVRCRTEHFVYAHDISETVLCKAELVGAVGGRLTPENLGGCDAVFIALYPDGILGWLLENAPRVKKGAIVMDTGGVKQAVCAPAEKIASENGFFFIGAHPMAGVEHTGFDSSRKELFEAAPMILTPPKGTPIEIMEKVKKLCIEIGFSNVVITTPAHHDRMIAYTSQLAHVVSSAYVKSPLALSHKGYSAGSYRDMTRVATLNEQLWTSLFLNNRAALVSELDGLMLRLSEYREALARADANTLCALLRDGREQKERADGKVL